MRNSEKIEKIQFLLDNPNIEDAYYELLENMGI